MRSWERRHFHRDHHLVSEALIGISESIRNTGTALDEIRQLYKVSDSLDLLAGQHTPAIDPANA
jgi:hypothetical protein